MAIDRDALPGDGPDPPLWLIDGNNVFGSRPDGWWNDRAGAMRRLTQTLGEWCRTHPDLVTVVFDRPVPDDVMHLGGGNLTVLAARRSGRNAADDELIALLTATPERSPAEPGRGYPRTRVVTSDRGLRQRLPDWVDIWGVGRFRDLIGY